MERSGILVGKFEFSPQNGVPVLPVSSYGSNVLTEVHNCA